MNFLKFHILPFIAALGVGFLVFHNQGDILSRKAIVKEPAPVGITYMANYASGYSTEIWLRSHLRNKSLVIFGSSELTNQHTPYVPNRFLGAYCTGGCVAFGHAGSQCFNICSQLMSYAPDAKGARIAIILSPGWFEEYSRGTSVPLFLEFNHPRALSYDPSLPVEFTRYRDQYIAEHFDEINSPDVVIKEHFFHGVDPVRSVLQYPVERINHALLDAKKKIWASYYAENRVSYPYDFLAGENKMIVDKLPGTTNTKVDWDSLEEKSLADFELTSDNNTLGITNEYYDTYIKGGKLRKAKPVNEERNQELQDLRVLLTLLKYLDVDAYFIMQGLNPHSYSNLADLDPTIQTVLNDIKSAGFEYFNMYTSDKERYVKGTLSDVFHTADYGWLQVDRALMEHYCNN